MVDIQGKFYGCTLEALIMILKLWLAITWNVLKKLEVKNRTIKH